jgi:hypothetical protein
MSAQERTVQLDDFSLGMNNRAPDFRLERREGRDVRSFVRNAVNADVTKEGTLRRRQGYARVVAGTACHSYWADGAVAYFADGASLVRMNPDLSYSMVHSDLAYGAPVSFAPVGDDIYYTDGARQRRLAADGSDHAAGAPPLLVTPTVVAEEGAGSLPAGRYQLCFTQVNDDGEESGSTVPVQVELEAVGAIQVTGLPALVDDIAAVRVYLTEPNGTTLQRALTFSTGSPALTIAAMPALGARCPTLQLAAMPAGRIVRHCMGRLLVAVAGVLFYSEPFAPALRNPTRGWMAFPDPITMVEPCENGFFVATAKATYWVGGDAAAAELQPVLPYGAIYGASGRVEDELACWWMSTQGMVRGAADGTVKNLQADAVAVEPAAAGAALYREHDGMRQAVAALFGAEQTPLVARSYMDAEIVRKGTTL